MSLTKKLRIEGSVSESQSRDLQNISMPSLERFIENFILGYHATHKPVGMFSTTIESYPFNTSIIDRWKRFRDPRYAAKAEARDYMLQDVNVLGERGTGKGLGAETVYKTIDLLPGRYFADPRIAAGLGLLLGKTMVKLWVNTVGDLGEASPHRYVDITIQAVRREALRIMEYFKQRDIQYRQSFEQALNSIGAQEFPKLLAPRNS